MKGLIGETIVYYYLRKEKYRYRDGHFVYWNNRFEHEGDVRRIIKSTKHHWHVPLDTAQRRKLVKHIKDKKYVPDFLVHLNSQEIIFFEVKYGNSVLNKNQKEFKNLCKELNIKYNLLRIKNITMDGCEILIE